jgi:hypothetical protein
MACILLFSFVRIANLCVMTQLVGSSNATYHYVSNRSHNRVFFDFPCATKSKIGTRLQQAGKLIAFVLLVADVMISKVGRPSDVPRLYAHGNSDGEMHAGFCVIYLWAAGRCRGGERGQAGTGGTGMGPCTAAGGSASGKYRKSSRLCPHETSNLNLEFPAWAH